MVKTAFAHIGLTCRDPVAIERFYVKHFGFRRARVVPLGGDDQIVFIKSAGVYIELFKAKEKSPLPLPTNDGYAFPGLRHLAFAVDNVEAKIAEMGSDAKVMLGPARFDAFLKGWAGAWLADPEGNIIELSEGYVDE
jgi:glyoxylase I family protein